MKLTLFKNKKGLIHGGDPKRISCEREGVLKIGKTEIPLTPGEEAIMPMLCQGSTGNYEAVFHDKNGEIYRPEKVFIRAGWIQPPHPMTAELMELRCRTEIAEEKIEKLENIFDTDSLNFLIRS